MNFLVYVYWASLVAACFLALPAIYLGILALLAKPEKPLAQVPATRFFSIVVPAHNEAQSIAATVQSLCAIDYPKDKFAVVVVADNCSDETAKIAQQAGARVLQRTHETLKGKGYALEFAYDLLLKESISDAIVVVDADTIVSDNLLQAFAARLAQGALAVQAEYGVRNPDSSWRTRLMAVALAMFHRLRSLARERLRVSAGLRGNGMCFSKALLQQFGQHAYGLVEDVEYGITLGLGGVRVFYADEAKVLGEMVSGAKASESQRQRWEQGRSQLIRQRLPVLALQAIRQRSLLLADLAFDLATPPLSKVGLFLVFGLILEGVLAFFGVPPHAATYIWATGWLGLILYVVRGIQLSNLGWRAVSALCWAPVYVVWKVILALRPKSGKDQWVRTKREGETNQE